MRCSVVFGVRLRLLVINISSSFPAINTAAHYQRCDITCETVAVVLRRTCLQHLACCSVNTGSQAGRYRLRIAISAYPTCIRCPLGGSRRNIYCYAVWHGKTKMVWLQDGEKFWCYVYSFWHNPRTWQADTHTQTPHDGIGRAYA